MSEVPLRTLVVLLLLLGVILFVYLVYTVLSRF